MSKRFLPQVFNLWVTKSWIDCCVNVALIIFPESATVHHLAVSQYVDCLSASCFGFFFIWF
jgi:hypothetical protein